MSIGDQIISYLARTLIVMCIVAAVAAALSILAVLITILITLVSVLIFFYPSLHNPLSRMTLSLFDRTTDSPLRIPLVSRLLSVYALFAITVWTLTLSVGQALVDLLLYSLGLATLPNPILSLLSISLLIGIPLGLSLALFSELDTPGGGPFAAILDRFRR